ncbi:MAG TPA: serine hydrolase domain-containing protein [Sphingomicrobium sp.]|nr:serine hydrolase domain-containing protein [Sphingomicrobium sp.]
MRLRRPFVGLAAAGMAVAAIAQTPTAPPPSLEGLWVGKLRYGPDVRGRLLILPRGNALVADIAGFTVPVRSEGSSLSFELPDGKGSFRGVRDKATIDGQWIQAVTATSGAAYATPVILRSDGRGGWSGEVEPLDDHMTYYLPVARNPDGRFSTYLRNPERNQGVFLGVSRIEQDGDTVRLVGTRRGQQQESLIASGRRDAASDIMTIPIQGRTFDFRRDTSASSEFYPRGTPPERYRYVPPVQVDDGWPVSTLEKEGIDQAAIEKFVQKLIDMPMDGISSSQIHSVLIARNGKLVLEEYFHGHDRDTPHDTRSAAKSWTNVLIGAAMQSGVPIRLDTPVYQTLQGQLPADLDPRKKSMNLEHLISMTAGFDCDDSGDRPGDEDVMQEQTKQPDWYRFALDVPMAWNSGDKIVYCSMKPNLAGGMLEKIAGEPMPEMFYRLVAKPMKMGRYHLFLQPTGQAYGGGGHHFTTRDFMKLTQLFLNDGQWDGWQIVSREWARKSGAALRVLSPTSGQTYGYLWNSVAYDYQGRKLHAYFPGGNGGQVYIGIPDLNLLIAFTGGNYADRVLFRSQREFVPQDILPAVR